jgi:hypothetical protein
VIARYSLWISLILMAGVIITSVRQQRRSAADARSTPGSAGPA